MAHGQRKRRRKIGSVSPDGRGGWYVRVSRGYRADGTRRTVNAHVEGTYEDADAECLRIYMELGGSPASGGSLTLRQYYYGVFRKGKSVRGTPPAATPPSKATTRRWSASCSPRWVTAPLASVLEQWHSDW